MVGGGGGEGVGWGWSRQEITEAVVCEELLHKPLECLMLMVTEGT